MLHPLLKLDPRKRWLFWLVLLLAVLALVIWGEIKAMNALTELK